MRLAQAEASKKGSESLAEVATTPKVKPESALPGPKRVTEALSKPPAPKKGFLRRLFRRKTGS